MVRSLLPKKTLFPIILILTLIAHVFLIQRASWNDVHPKILEATQNVPSSSEIDFVDCNGLTVIWIDKSPQKTFPSAKESKVEFVNSILRTAVEYQQRNLSEQRTACR